MFDNRHYHHPYGHHHYQTGPTGPPHTLILTFVIILSVIIAFTLGGQAEVLTETISEILSPLGLLLLPIAILLLIHFLSSSQGSVASAVFSTGEPNSIHRVSGSPVGVALVLLVVVVLLINRVSIFGGDDDGGD